MDWVCTHRHMSALQTRVRVRQRTLQQTGTGSAIEDAAQPGFSHSQSLHIPCLYTYKESYDRQRTDSVYLLAGSAYAFLLFLPSFSCRLIVCCLGHASFSYRIQPIMTLLVDLETGIEVSRRRPPDLGTLRGADGGGSARGWRVKASWLRIERNAAKWLFFRRSSRAIVLSFCTNTTLDIRFARLCF